MYLSDRDIKAILGTLSITTDHPNHVFDPGECIQPCSIDLLLSNVFWKPIGRATIDLRKSKLLELSPRRHWRKIELKEGEFIVLRPGEYILAHTYEKVSMPNDLAGKIEGRSSFSRMGLSVHCTQDFINPGWHGYMPLQLVNNGPFSIRISPYIPICQMMLIRLSSTVETPYGDKSLQSKYMNDDGGPSYWWRDKRIKRLQERLGQADITLAMQNEILSLTSEQDPDILLRLEQYAEQLLRTKQENAHSILESFAKEESKRKRREIIGKVLVGMITTPIVGFVMARLYDARDHLGIKQLLLIIPVAIITALALLSFKYTQGPFFDEKELLRVYNRKANKEKTVSG